MKPTFALNLSHDSVGLLHRTPRGWMPVGDVAFASPSLADDLGAIRSTALGLSPKGITTKLVIPNSEILYIEVEAPGPDAATRRRQIRSALKGKTPYDVEELVFDWWGKGPVVQVAVIWKGTLEEAEAFADEHRFNPVSFVAIPDEGRFKGEPWFGMTKVAATILSAGEKVERDQDPVTVLAREMPKSEAPVVAVPPPEPQPPAAPAAAPAPMAEAPAPPRAAVAAPAAPVAPQPAAASPAAAAPPEPVPPVPAPRPEPQPAPPPEQPPAEPAPAPPPQEIADPPPVEVPDFDPPSETFPEVSTQPAPARPLSARITPSVIVDEAVDEAPMALDVPETADPARDASAEADLPPPPSAAAMAAFASRRTATDSGAVRPAPAPARPPIPGGLAGARPPVERPAAARPAPRITAEGLASRPVAASPATRPSTLSPPAKPLVRPEPSAKVVKGLGGTVSVPVPPAGRKVRPSDAAGLAETPAVEAGTAPATPAAKPSRAPANAFGTRPPLPQRGKPRYLGLILTLILLFLMALVAAWSSFYLTSAEQESATVASTVEPDLSEADLAALSAAEAEADGEAIETMAPDPAEALAPAAPPEEPPTAVAANLPAEPAPPAEVAAEPADADLPEAATAENVAAEAGPVDPAAALEPEPEVAAAAAPEPEPAPQSEPAPETLVGTEAASAPALASEPQDEIFLAAMDRPPVTADPAALTVPSRGNDALPPAQLPPPPFGTVYQFDADGLILPTPEGIMTPEGVLLVAGPPAILPPERPASIAPAAAPAAAEPAAEPTVAVAPGALANPEAGVAASALVPADPAVDPFVADPELAGVRPRLRPEGLVPPAAAAGDDASLAPAADSRFASLRPRERSPAVVSAAVAAEAALAAASTAAVATAEPQSPLIVAVSRKPAPRPRDLSRAVEAAVAAAVRAPDPVPQAEPEPEPQQVVAAVAPAPAKPAKPADPEEEDEPEVDTSRDRSPALKGTVAKQATFVNALNMSKLSLIGVYGTQSQRYALVREPTGRYRKVKVGDRIDGGKVAAITANEVRYQKGGRMVTLAMPRG